MHNHDVELKEYSNGDAKAYTAVSCIGFYDGKCKAFCYGENDDDSINEEYQVVVEVEDNSCGEYLIINCIVYLRDHETETKFSDTMPGPRTTAVMSKTAGEPSTKHLPERASAMNRSPSHFL